QSLGLAGELGSLVSARGRAERAVSCRAGPAGVIGGESLIRPTHAPRRESCQPAIAKSGRLLVLATLLLIGCGFIEGYLAPDPDFPMINRLIVGIGYWIIMIGALTGRLFGRTKPVDG